MPDLGTVKQEDHGFEPSLGYLGKLSLKKAIIIRKDYCGAMTVAHVKLMSRMNI
jgi:hypothetical protein